MQKLDEPIHDSHPSGGGVSSYLNMYDKWKCLDDIRAAGLGAPPLADELFTNVLRSFNDAIEWHRVGVFQDVTIRMLAQQMLHHRQDQPTKRREIYLTNELGHGRAFLERSLIGERRYHFYCSPHTPL